MQVLLYPFMVLSAVGLVASVIVHVLAHLGYAPLGEGTFVLHIGIFVVWFPAILSIMRTRVLRVTTSINPRAGLRTWQQIVRGSPRWMQWMTVGFIVYGIANFILFVALGGAARMQPGSPDTPAAVVGFSGHWMIFYSAALTILYSAVKTWNAPLKCPSGHLVSPIDRFCPECGAALTPTQS